MTRIILVLLALMIAAYTLMSAMLESYVAERPSFPTDPMRIEVPASKPLPRWLYKFMQFRPDLESRYALIAALDAMQSLQENRPNPYELAATVAGVRQVLSVAPYNPELWLALAWLQARQDPQDPLLIGALKMAYFTAPNDARLMPIRLDTATRFDALSDLDLKALAQGDVRLMVTRDPQLKAAVVSAYRGASSKGKAFLEEAVQTIDPLFLPALRGQK